MGRQVIRQPDGRLATWSTVIDGFTLVDADPEEIAEYYAREAYEEERQRWLEACERAQQTGTSSRYRHGMQWTDAMERYREAHGRDFDPADPFGERWTEADAATGEG